MAPVTAIRPQAFRFPTGSGAHVLFLGLRGFWHPIFHVQPRYALEFPHVVCNQGGLKADGMRAYEQIHRTDDLTLAFQLGADFSISQRGCGVEIGQFKRQ